jgi:mannose-6-phosphate isomerase-like protein (cupin superfamily)
MVKFIPKPWGGGEYTIYSNENVEVKHLTIKQGECTSLHCHPKKKTGLCVLKGLIKVDFLNDSFWLEPGDKLMIRPGVFHRSNAKLDSELLEIENPVDKDDLVRLEDNYERKQGYEKQSIEVEKEVFNFNTIQFDSILCRHNEAYGNDLFTWNEGKYLILNGGIFNIFEDKKVYVLSPGDLIDSKIITHLVNKFTPEKIEYIHVQRI